MVEKFELEMEKSRELGEDETRLGPQDKVDLVGVVYKSIFCNTGCFLATLVALHFTPVSCWVGRSFGLA